MTPAIADLPGLQPLWAQLVRHEPPAAPIAIRPLLDSLGLGMGETMEELGQGRPDWPAFLAWIAATATTDPALVARYRAWVAGTEPSAEELARRDALMAAPDVLDTAELARWERDGVAVLRGAITPAEAAAIADRLWAIVGGDPDDPATWYAGRAGGIMVGEFQHAAMLAPRRSARVHKAFAQLYGHADLIVSTDRLSFNPPERPGYSFQGPHLHWDANLTPPIALETQAILYLTETAADQGALQVVPGFHHRLADGWLEALGDADPRAIDLSAEAVTVPAGAGDLVIWRHDLPHGASPNRSERPRLAQYVNMYPMQPADQRPWR